jgi:hypothetical protein
MGGHWSAIRFFEGLIDRHFPQRDFWGGCLITEFIAYTFEELVDLILVLFRSRIPRCQFVEHSAHGDAEMVGLAILDCFGLNHQPFRLIN